MNALPRHHGLLPKLTLLAFMLLAQGFVFAHEIDHFAAGDNNLCAVCSIGHGLDSTTITSHPAPLCGPDVRAPAERPAVGQAGAAWGVPQARAPPTLSASFS
jgi:hypothetical protein